MSSSFGRLLCVLLSLAASVGVLAETSADSVRLYLLDSVEVQAKRIITEVVPAKRMDAQVIEGLSCQSVADAIRYFSGVQLKDYGGVGGVKTINVRSMGTNQMGVFYDGIQLGNAQNGQVDLGRFSLDNIEAIELYNGNKSSMLQSAKDYGAAGTIYLQTKRPSFADGETFHVAATMKTGSFGLANPSFAWQQRLANGLSMMASAEYTYAHGRYKFRNRQLNTDGTVAYDTTMVRRNADINAARAEVALFGTMNDGEYRVQVYNYYSARGLPGYVARNVYEHHQRQWDDNFFVQGSVRKNFGERYALSASAKYAYDYTRYLNPDSTTLLTDQTYRQQEIYASLAQTVKIFKWWDVALSTDFQWNTLSADLVDFAFPNRYTGLVALATAIKFPNVRVQASCLGTFVHETVRQHTAAPNRHAFTPSVVLAVRPMRRVPFELRAFYKRIFRLPTFNDLYYTFVGSALLDPEYVSQYDVGVCYTYEQPQAVFAQFHVEADAYYNNIENKIVAVPGSNPFRWQMMNLGKVHIVGVDATASALLVWCKWWKFGLTANYTFQRARDLTDPTESYYGHQIPYTPWHSGSVIANLGYKRWQLNYSFIYTGERYDQSANIPENYVQPWYTHDVSLSGRFDLKKCWLTASVDVNNVFNQQYDVVLNYPMPGTNFKITLKVEV